MRVGCPQCHSPIELPSDGELSDIACPSCGSSFSLLGTAETMPFEAGTRTIGHFELIEKVGVGTFGFVWKASDTELDRTVALKVPRKGQLDPGETEQFLREARAAAQLRHANIVSVHEVGRDQDTVFIVSDFVEGATLADRLATQRLSIRESAQLCVTMAEALHHAHEAGVVHRDLKPGNVMLNAAGQPHIMDFGLARREAGEVTMTVEGRVLGTPAYMSPEQARGASQSRPGRSPRPKRTWRWCKRNPLLAGLTSSMALLLLALSFGSLILLQGIAERAAAEKETAERMATFTACQLRFNTAHPTDETALLAEMWDDRQVEQHRGS